MTINKYDEYLHLLIKRKKYDLANYLWQDIESNLELVKQASDVKRDKFDERYSVNCLTICEWILINYQTIDSEAYTKLANVVLQYQDIAKIRTSNDKFSFLLLLLGNPNFKLSKEQKDFIENEAEYKLAPISVKNEREEPLYLTNVNNHGVYPYDIRYHILINSNWSNDEKAKLISRFFCDEDSFNEILMQWEWGIVNDEINYRDDSNFIYDGYSYSILEIDRLYDYTYLDLVKKYGNEKNAKDIWKEIEFCRTIRSLEVKFGGKIYELKM